MISNVLATTVSTANKATRVFIMTTLLQEPEPSVHRAELSWRKCCKKTEPYSARRAFAMSPPCLIGYQTLKEDDYRELKEVAYQKLREAAY
jgi:hypothetical protein